MSKSANQASRFCNPDPDSGIQIQILESRSGICKSGFQIYLLQHVGLLGKSSLDTGEDLVHLLRCVDVSDQEEIFGNDISI